MSTFSPTWPIGRVLALSFFFVLSGIVWQEAAMAKAPESTSVQESAGTQATAEGDREEGLLFVHGRLRQGAETLYAQYVAGTGPLLAEFGAEVRAVGAAAEGAQEVAEASWPINALLAFPSVEAAESFLSDPRYLELKENYRDKAYEELHLTLVRGRAPRVRTPRDVAIEAFGDFKHGLATGEWQGFFDRLHDDFTFRFPAGKFQGMNHGKAKAEEFFNFVSVVYPKGLFVRDVERITGQGETVVFEFFDEGEMRGKPYSNHVAISLDVCGEQICGYREYFGLVGPAPGEAAEVQE